MGDPMSTDVQATVRVLLRGVQTEVGDLELSGHRLVVTGLARPSAWPGIPLSGGEVEALHWTTQEHARHVADELSHDPHVVAVR